MSGDGPELEHVLRHLDAAPYLVRRKFISTKIRPKYPRFVYKYRSVDPADPKSIQFARDIILDSHLWLSSPIDFNDPFDMGGAVTVEGTVNERERKIRGLLGKHRPELRWKSREAEVRRLMAMPREDWNRVVKTTHRHSIENVGVCSLSDDPRGILMWSHYAGQHTGICIQFEVGRDPRTFLGALSVDYCEDYPVVNWLSDTAEQLKRVILRKHDAWAYERERRIIRIQAARTRLRISHDAITGVILGCRATETVESSIRELLEERRGRGMSVPALYRARQHDRKYRLVIAKAGH